MTRTKRAVIWDVAVAVTIIAAGAVLLIVG